MHGINLNKVFYLTFLVFLAGNVLYAQNSIFTETKTLLENGFPNKALKKLNEIDTLRASSEIKGRVYEMMGLIYDKNAEDDKAFDYYTKSIKQYQLAKDKLKEQKINLDIYYLLSSDSLLHNKAKKYYDAFYQYAQKTQNDSLIAEALMAKCYTLIKNNPIESRNLLLKVVEISDRIKNNSFAERAYTNLGALYNERLNNPDSAIYYLDESFKIIQKKNNPEDLIYYYTNKAGAYYYKNDIEKAIETLKKGIELPISHVKYHEVFYFLAFYYAENNDYANAYETFVKYNELKNQKNDEELNKSISEMATKYESQEKELENLKLKTKLQNNSIIMISVGAIFIILGGFSYFGYKNILRKKKIIEQEKLIQDQKLINLLKEQELHDIDLILESQEKERQRIANELHDNLGSLMATLKFNFENIKNKQNDDDIQDTKLFNHTNELLDEAYAKIRTISHIKNLGVMAHEGLLVAVKKMADKMSVPNRLQFKVIAFGLKERIDNPLEITLFRIIQELATNIIKHSEATEVNIYLTQHGKSELNLMIEDNGKGFDHSKIKKNDGIGLKTIEKRIEKMGGVFNIDSHPSNGTTVIIDIPI